jgi:hypothetical protein
LHIVGSTNKKITFIVILSILLPTIVLIDVGGSVKDGGQKTVEAYSGNPVLTNGTYMGHSWYIDRNHMIWWDGEPYIRYGFTGSPRMDDIDEFIDMGFDQFTVGASESRYVFSDDQTDHIKDRDDIDNYTTTLTSEGCTYFVYLNTLLPWKNSGKISDEGRITFVHRKSFDVTGYGGRSTKINLLMPFEESYKGYTLKDESTAYLFDFSTGQMTDISDRIDDMTWEEVGDELDEAKFNLVISFSRIDFPISTHLAIVVSVPIRHETVFGFDFPALWKDEIRSYYIHSLNFFRSAFQKEGLRGMMFSDEIGMSNKTFFIGTYEDFNEDLIVMTHFHRWLKDRFGDVGNLNRYLRTNYNTFEEVNWDVTPLPYESIEHLNEVGELFGLYDSVEQVERRNSLQNDFMFWFYGHNYAEYAKIAKKVIGDVPVFITTWASQNADPLQIHYEAMLEGMDGLIRNSYGQVVTDDEGRKGIGFRSEEGVWMQDLRDVKKMIERAERKSGYTKAYIANEFYWVQVTDEGNVRFKFPTKSDLKEFLKVMIDHGYRGFHMFIINPSDVYHSEEVMQREDMLWFSELKPEILGYMIGKGTVKGEVKALSGGKVPNATILISHTNGTVFAETRTGTDGLFSLPYSSIDGYDVPEGAYVITVIKTGYEPLTKNLTVTKGEITYVSLTLQPKRDEGEAFGNLWLWALMIVIAVMSLTFIIRKKA